MSWKCSVYYWGIGGWSQVRPPTSVLTYQNEWTDEKGQDERTPSTHGFVNPIRQSDGVRISGDGDGHSIEILENASDGVR